MPRRKETLFTNRKAMKQAREELRALPAEERDALVYDGIGPGDSYIGF